MLSEGLAISVLTLYAGAFLALALWGDARGDAGRSRHVRVVVYALGSCVHCSAWSFCGSIAMASKSGADFLPMYLGPALAFAFGRRLLGRVVRLAKAHNITSLADFVAARYGKATSVAATITVVATLASIPFIALQVRVLAQALAIFVDHVLPLRGALGHTARGLCVVLTGLLIVVTILVGARRLDATEHQQGLMLAVAVESAIKLLALLGIGAFVCWGMFNGIGDLTDKVAHNPRIARLIDKPPDPVLWLSLSAAAMATAFVVPRQFHVSIVENRDEADVRTIAWFVPLYLAASAAFVLPLAAAGLATFPPGTIDRDFTLIALPMRAHSPLMSLVAILGTASAATSMVLVTATTLAIMVSNDLVMPFLVRRRSGRSAAGQIAAMPILAIRRTAIVVILVLALVLAVSARSLDLSTAAVISFAGVAQVAPAAIGGLVWRQGTARGAIGGTLAGMLVAAYTLVLPTLVAGSSTILTRGPLGLDALRPTDLLGLDLAPFAQALIWSLSANLVAYCGLSLTRPPNASERLQANIFLGANPMPDAATFRFRRSSVTVGDLLDEAAHYLPGATVSRVFHDWHVARDLALDRAAEADAPLILYAERLIATAIGAASSRMVMALMLRKGAASDDAARRIIDDATLEIQESRDILQHAIDVARDGMAVFDADLRLVAWNRAYREMFELPGPLMRVGTPLDVMVRSNAERGLYGHVAVDDFVAARLEALMRPTEGQRFYGAPRGRVLEMRSVRLRNGGLFFTYSDATAQVTSEEQLEAENLTLERRVRERTEDLEHLNLELLRAKAEAEDANVSKSRFLAAASHDLLQPLSAARLYATSLHDRLKLRGPGDATAQLAANVDESLEAVEEILGALLEVSRIDAGAISPEITSIPVGNMLRQLQMEFEPLARARGMRLRFVASSLRVTSDRKLLRRMLQNLVSNAIKYTNEGSVLVGVRRQGGSVRIEVHDTGIGIPESKQKVVFREFERLSASAEASPGAGLGLSIVERLSHVLQHRIGLRSTESRGSVFSVTVPIAEALSLADTNAAGTAPKPRSLEHLVVAAIDNESHVLSAMAVLLEGWDCTVARGTTQPDLERALEETAREPDVIVADYHIGDVDGLAVIAALRRRYGHRPAVLVTADRNAAIRDLAQAADVRVLHKPLKPAALRALLSQWHLVKAAAAE